MKLLFFLLFVLFSQSPSDNGGLVAAYVTTREYKKYDCQAGKKLKGKPLFPSTVLSPEGSVNQLLKVRVLRTDETPCIKARNQELIRVQPLQLSSGEEIPFIEQRKGIVAPELQQHGPRTPPPRIIPPNVAVQIRGIELLTAFVVDIEGKVPICKVARSSGFPDWDDWACQKAQTRQYSPAMKNGTAIAVTVIEFLQTTFH